MQAAQVPPDIEAGLRKIGQIVDPACTAKLYRPLMPKNDYNTYWPPECVGTRVHRAALSRESRSRATSRSVRIQRTWWTSSPPTRAAATVPVLIYVPGGGGNKIEQQAREGNAFYDNIGRWATKNGMVGVTVQRHPGTELG